MIEIYSKVQEFWLAKRAKHVYSEAARVFQFEEVCRRMDGERAVQEMAGEL